MVKTLKNLRLQNQKSYDLETWHVSLGTQALQILYKWWPWVDLDLIYGKVKFGHLYVWMGKTVIKSFNWGKLAAKDYIDWIILFMKKNDLGGVVCPCPGAVYMYITIIFKHLLWNHLANQCQISYESSLGSGKESLCKWYRSHDQAGPYMVKTFKNLLLQNQKSYDLETWHIALGAHALQSLYKWWPWVYFDLFYLFLYFQ